MANNIINTKIQNDKTNYRSINYDDNATNYRSIDREKDVNIINNYLDENNENVCSINNISSSDLPNINILKKYVKEDNANNGLITKIWGPSLWIGLHCISFGYPINPTKEQKIEYMNFFKSVGDVLPCKYCRESYKNFLLTGNTKLNLDVMENRETLTKWLYLIHNAVNEKLEVNYGVSYENVVERYESYRASCSKIKTNKFSSYSFKTNESKKGCLNPLNTKAKSFIVADIKDCPIIPLNIAKEFINYAKLRKCSKSNFEFIDFIKKNRKEIGELIRNNDNMWNKRNIECYELIMNMRKYSLPSLESKGKWKGLPTIDELKLILRLSSNLTSENVASLINKLPFFSKKYKVYRLVNL